MRGMRVLSFLVVSWSRRRSQKGIDQEPRTWNKAITHTTPMAEFAILVHSDLLDLVLSYLHENGIHARAAGTNAIVVETSVREIDIGMTFFPLSPEGQAGAIAATMLKSTKDVKEMGGVSTFSTFPFHCEGELENGEAEGTLLMHYCDPRAELYRSVPGPECREGVRGRGEGGVWVMYRATRRPEAYSIEGLGMRDDQIYPAAHFLIDKVEHY